MWVVASPEGLLKIGFAGRVYLPIVHFPLSSCVRFPKIPVNTCSVERKMPSSLPLYKCSSLETVNIAGTCLALFLKNASCRKSPFCNPNSLQSRVQTCVGESNPVFTRRTGGMAIIIELFLRILNGTSLSTTFKSMQCKNGQ